MAYTEDKQIFQLDAGTSLSLTSTIPTQKADGTEEAVRNNPQDFYNLSAFLTNRTPVLTDRVITQKGDGTEDAGSSLISEVLGLGGKVNTLKVSISSAEILAIGTTPVVLVPAIANKILSPINAIIKYNYSTAAYATSTDLQLEVASSYSFAIISNLINQTINKTAISIGGNTTMNSAITANKAIQLTTSGGADPTAGSGTLTVYLTYAIIDF